MQTVLIAVHLMIVVALVAVVLLQRSEGGALGVGGGSGFMTGRGQANVLTRATAILAALFFMTSLALTLIARYGHGNKLDFNAVVPLSGTAEPGTKVPPPGTGTVLDQVRQLEQQRKASGASSATPSPGPGPTTPANSTTVVPAPTEPSGMPSRTAPAAGQPAAPKPAGK